MTTARTTPTARSPPTPRMAPTATTMRPLGRHDRMAAPTMEMGRTRPHFDRDRLAPADPGAVAGRDPEARVAPVGDVRAEWSGVPMTARVGGEDGASA
jgi:hypothetical protein